jgi:hypothetical protein
MPRCLNLHTFAEKKPEHGQVIFLLRSSTFYGTVEPLFTEIEYTWVEVDENGGETGEQVLFDPEDPTPPEGCRLELTLSYSEKDLWCPASDVDGLIE